MTISTNSETRRESLNIRIKPEEKKLIDRAARLRGKNRTSFILDAVRAAAEDALYDQVVIMADGEAFQKFLDRLDMQPHPNEHLRKTMRTPAPWETT